MFTDGGRGEGSCEEGGKFSGGIPGGLAEETVEEDNGIVLGVGYGREAVVLPACMGVVIFVLVVVAVPILVDVVCKEEPGLPPLMRWLSPRAKRTPECSVLGPADMYPIGAECGLPSPTSLEGS